MIAKHYVALKWTLFWFNLSLILSENTQVGVNVKNKPFLQMLT